MLLLASLSGSPNRNSLSKRPGRRSAGSMASKRFVAPITTTSPRASKPSIRARSVDTMELQDGHNKRVKVRQLDPSLHPVEAVCSDLWMWSCLLERTGARPSISSKKMMEGRM